MSIRMFILISKALVLFFNEVAPPFEVDPPALCMAAAQGDPAQTSPSSNVNFSPVICLKIMRPKSKLRDESSQAAFGPARQRTGSDGFLKAD